MSHHTWDLEELPRGEKKAGLKWVYKHRLGARENVERDKARFVVMGFTQQQEDVDFG